jgi:elongation factor 1-delta
MQFPLSMMHDNVWVDRLNYIEAEEFIHLPKTSDGQVVSNVSSSLVSEISNMRANIKSCVSGVTTTTTTTDSAHVAKLETENKSLKKLIDDLSKQVSDLTLRVGKLEGGSSAAPAAAAAPKAEEKEEDDDDFDIFGDDDDEEEEETEEEKKIREDRLAAYHAKKAKKEVVIAKSSLVLDVKPWDDETDMAKMEECVRTIQCDGLVWGQSKLVPLAYGIKKLQICAVIEDDKVSTDWLDDEITKFEEYIQSMDIAKFNKI